MKAPKLRAAMLLGPAIFAVCSAAMCQQSPEDSSAAQVSGGVTAPPAPSSTTAPVPFAAVDKILARSCSVCHNDAGASTTGNLSLEAGKTYSALVGRPSSEAPLALVQAGKPDQSYLLAKIEGWHLRAGGSGELMPLGQGRLSPDKIALVRAWIAQGAKPD